MAVRSANRQTWINALRDQVAQYISITGVIHAGDWSNRTEIEFDQKMERLALIGAKVRLMLNPKEEDHQRLGEIPGEILLTMGGRVSAGNKRDAQKARTLVEKLVPLSQSILKREWERVKRVE